MTEEEKEKKKKNQEIEQAIKKDKAISEKEIKMLLLGMKTFVSKPRFDYRCR